MPAVINTNLASLFAQGSLNQAQSSLSTSVQRLSSGLRINSAKDDASGLSIGQQMSGHIRALDQANLNAQQAINLAQTADTSIGTVQDILLRMQQLAVVGANGSLSNSQRGAVVTELQNLNSQINSTSTGTTYNNIVLLGTTGSIDLANSTLANGIGAGTFGSVSNLIVSQSTSTLITFSNSGNNLQAYNGTVTQAVTLAAGTIGTAQTVNFNQLGVSFTLTSAGVATAADLATGLNGKKTTITLAGIGNLNFQVGATSVSGDQITIAGYNISTGASSSSSAMTALGTLITGSGTNLTGLQGAGSPTDSQWTTAFQSLQTQANTALSDLSTQRAVMGAKMNQLGYITTNLEAQAANERAARSTIVDTNYSMETAALTKGQILQQAATAMLAQANQMPNVILSLLK